MGTSTLVLRLLATVTLTMVITVCALYFLRFVCGER